MPDGIYERRSNLKVTQCSPPPCSLILHGLFCLNVRCCICWESRGNDIFTQKPNPEAPGGAGKCRAGSRAPQPGPAMRAGPVMGRERGRGRPVSPCAYRGHSNTRSARGAGLTPSPRLTAPLHLALFPDRRSWGADSASPPLPPPSGPNVYI